MYPTRTKRTATVKTKTLCIMYTVQKEELLACLLDFPEIKEYMVMIAKGRKGRIDKINAGEKIEEFVDDEDSKTELFMGTVMGSPSPSGGDTLNKAGRRSSTMKKRGSRRGSGMGLDNEAVQKIVERQNRKEESVRKQGGRSRTTRRRVSDLSFNEGAKRIASGGLQMEGRSKVYRG